MDIKSLEIKDKTTYVINNISHINWLYRRNRRIE